MAQNLAAINLSFAGTSSVQAFSQSVQQITLLDATNLNYLRQIQLSQNGVKLSYLNNVVLIPIAQLWSAADAALPVMTWPPIISQNPSNLIASASVGTASFSVVASAETPITYQWMIAHSSSNPTWTPLTSSVEFTGSKTTLLFISQSGALNNYWFQCAVNNTSGGITSSYAQLNLI